MAFHSTVQIKVSLVKTLTLSDQDGGDRLHVLVVGHAGLAVGPVLEVRLHDGEGLKGKKVAAAGSGMLESE